MSKGLEFTFLSEWRSWDEIDTSDLHFNEVTLNDVGRALLGDKADVVYSMVLFGQSSKIEFYDRDGDEPLATFDVKLVVA